MTSDDRSYGSPSGPSHEPARDQGHQPGHDQGQNPAQNQAYDRPEHSTAGDQSAGYRSGGDQSASDRTAGYPSSSDQSAGYPSGYQPYGTPSYGTPTAQTSYGYGAGQHGGDAGSQHGTSAYGTSAYGTGDGYPAGYGGYGTGGHDSGGHASGGQWGYATTPTTAAPGSPYYGGSPYGAPPAAPKKGSGTARTVLIAGIVALVVGGGVGAGVAAGVSGGSSSAGSVAFSSQTAPAAKVDGSIASAAQAISPSVATINVVAKNGNTGGTGSGIIINTSGDTGYILTNNHVVSLDSQTTATNNQISVTLNSGSTVDATVVGTDPADDLAVVKVQSSGLTAAAFAKSSDLQVGQTVVAMGAPLGLSNTVTSGIVSALARPVATGSSDSASIFNAIQTDAAINPGNSGGPLVDLNGHVVGVNSAIAGTSSSGSSDAQSGNIGIGFAIPSDEAARIANELIKTGKASHAVLGVTVGGGNQTNVGPTAGTGATVASVQSGSPAEQAGIKQGDVITKIGDQRIDDSVGAIAATRSFAPGTKIPVTVTSGGQSKTVDVTLGSATDS